MADRVFQSCGGANVIAGTKAAETNRPTGEGIVVGADVMELLRSVDAVDQALPGFNWLSNLLRLHNYTPRLRRLACIASCASGVPSWNDPNHLSSGTMPSE